MKSTHTTLCTHLCKLNHPVSAVLCRHAPHHLYHVSKQCACSVVWNMIPVNVMCSYNVNNYAPTVHNLHFLRVNTTGGRMTLKCCPLFDACRSWWLCNFNSWTLVGCFECNSYSVSKNTCFVYQGLMLCAHICHTTQWTCIARELHTPSATLPHLPSYLKHTHTFIFTPKEYVRTT